MSTYISVSLRQQISVNYFKKPCPLYTAQISPIDSVSTYISVSLRQQIKEHFKDCCAYCHTAEHLTVSIFECEHIIPKTAGGETIFENLCLACPTCNRYKATRKEMIDSQTDKLTSIFHPHKQNWEGHFTWNEDSSKIIPICGLQWMNTHPNNRLSTAEFEL